MPLELFARDNNRGAGKVLDKKIAATLEYPDVTGDDLLIVYCDRILPAATDMKGPDPPQIPNAMHGTVGTYYQYP